MNREERYKARREMRLRLHAERGPILPWDVVLTIALLVVACVALPVVTSFGGFAVFVSDGCRDDGCTTVVEVALWLGLGLPLVTVLVGIAVSVVRLVRHLRGWWTALVALLGTVLCLPLAWGVAILGTL